MKSSLLMLILLIVVAACGKNDNGAGLEGDWLATSVNNGGRVVRALPERSSHVLRIDGAQIAMLPTAPGKKPTNCQAARPYFRNGNQITIPAVRGCKINKIRIEENSAGTLVLNFDTDPEVNVYSRIETSKTERITTK